MKQSLSSLSTKLLALVSIAASIALTANALPAVSAEAHAATVQGATSPATGTEALALGAIQWQSSAIGTQGAMPVSSVSMQALERVGADLTNANTGVLVAPAIEAQVDEVVAAESMQAAQAEDAVIQAALAALEAYLAADAQG